MISLAICDDDMAFLTKAKKQVNEFLRANTDNCIVEVTEFHDAVVLRDNVVDGEIYDIFLLDMEMPKLGGVELACRIKKVLPQAVVVFLTSHIEFEYAQAGYTAQALRYISKLQMRETLPEALTAAIKAVPSNEEPCLIIKDYHDTVRVPYNVIMYVERVGRQLEINVNVKERPLYKESCGLNDLIERLNDPRFIFIGRSCFINVDYVLSIANSEIIMKNGETLPASKKMLPGLKELFFRLWGGII